jgi:hypothetical protein
LRPAYVHCRSVCGPALESTISPEKRPGSSKSEVTQDPGPDLVRVSPCSGRKTRHSYEAPIQRADAKPHREDRE